MEKIVIILLSVALSIAVIIAVYYYVSYGKILREYLEQDSEFEKMRARYKEICDKLDSETKKLAFEALRKEAKKQAVDKVIDKYRKG